jgi:hypothetical protein
MRPLALALLILAAGGTSTALRGQAVDAVMASIRNGGGWVSVPIEKGAGSASTVTLPAMGLTLNGCVRVWDGQSGHWTIRAHDSITGDSLVVQSDPGQGVPFTHTFGLRTQLHVDIAWSEPRDTTLFLWVGLGGGEDTKDACTPKS